MSGPLLHIPKRIVIHCSDTPNGVFVHVGAIRKFHTDPPPQGRGWSDIGYHLICQPDGQIEQGRPLNHVGAHVEGHNEGSIGICLIGKDKYTRAQLKALRYQIDSLMMVYQIKEADLYCHNQFDSAIKQGKTCPGFSVNELFVWYHLRDEKALNRVVMEGSV